MEPTRPEGAAGEKLGSLADPAVDQVSGRVGCAITDARGLHGPGDRCAPLPRALLAYDTGGRAMGLAPPAAHRVRASLFNARPGLFLPDII